MTHVLVTALYDRVRATLGDRLFQAQDEADLQRLVASVLTTAGFACDREVIAERGRYDIAVTEGPVTLVLELKIGGPAGPVERQAQRYALTDGVSGVAVVTNSQRLAHKLVAGTLGGKPFWVLALRTTF